MATIRRIPVVPQTSSLFVATIQLYPYSCPLRQVSRSISSPRARTDQDSFFNVEKTQVRPETAVQIHYTQPGGITGHIMLLCMLLMYTTAHHRIRQQSFETFWYTHHLFIPFLLGMYTHATGCFVRDSTNPYSPFAGAPFWNHCIGYEGWRWELIGGGFYLIERLYREIRSRRETAITKVVRHPYGTCRPRNESGLEAAKANARQTPWRSSSRNRQ